LKAASQSSSSTRVSFYGANTFLNGRGDLGRTEKYTRTDLAVTHKYEFGRDSKFTLATDVDVLNLFNENNVVNRQGVIFGSDLSDADVNFLLPNVTDELTFIGQIFNGGLAAQIRDLNTRGNAGAVTCGYPNDPPANRSCSADCNGYSLQSAESVPEPAFD